ncbi:haloacid dehalogenase-like hydrolase Tp14 [Theileria parva strain Muguga]|uniref:Haloacid dehalogenase-like hydrolase n=1 Tax=Theileria parva TaxID=5875 RepID=Q4N6U6_THEPA|nr:haloacid dehalogenase-like hydrolase Tp14 [Theileria parva strain Muguga]EAN34312.1 haloacid dehalogenase-like hydrolase Tp14 [Theileria parva strain Muguga]|eukprot:XP_766595.1 hypothetical protein [Theileria parva strain Muguga]
MDDNRRRGQRHHIFLLGFLCLLVIGLLTGFFTYYYTRPERMKSISKFVKPEKLPKYFAIDIDGTFFIKDPEKFKRNIAAFKRLQDAGVLPFFCTGRSYNCMVGLIGEKVLNECGYRGVPGVYLNGAVVYSPAGNVIHSASFGDAFVKAFQKFISGKNIDDKVVYQAPECCYCIGNFYEEGKKFLESKNLSLPIKMDEKDVSSIDIVGISLPAMKVELENMKEGKDYFARTAYNLITQLTPPKCSKKIALEALLKFLHSSGEECAYIGDDYNDVEPMEYCSLSFAVADAQNEVKEKAKWITSRKHDECAFEQVVSALLD